MSKESCIISLASKWHPLLSSWSKPKLLTYIDVFNIESIFEDCLESASNGKYKKIRDNPRCVYDFSDFSDAKTGSVVSNGIDRYMARVGAVQNKIGALRIAIYNHFIDDLEFFFIPSLDNLKAGSIVNQNNKAHLKWSYTEFNEHGKFGYYYQVPSFEACATRN